MVAFAHGASVVGLTCLAVMALGCRRPDASTAPPNATNTANVALPPPPVRLVGRFDKTDPEGVRFAWPGSTIVGRFRGTSLRARLKDEGHNYFQIVIDGAPHAVVQTDAATTTYVIAEHLPDGVHDVAIHKRTEAIVGEVVFQGFEPGPALLPPSQGLDRRVEIIGDSISAGYGNEGPAAACPFSPAEQNETMTYGAIAARALGAEHATIAWSGKTIRQMTTLFERTLPARSGSSWDFALWVPQLVVINLGTNDFAVRDPGEANYLRTYTELVGRVRKAYPEALIVCALGPMLSDGYPPGRQNLTRARRYMKSVTASLKTSGDARVELLEWPEQKHSDGLGCGFHPSVTTHKLMAERLVTLAKERLGW